MKLEFHTIELYYLNKHHSEIFCSQSKTFTTISRDSSYNSY